MGGEEEPQELQTLLEGADSGFLGAELELEVGEDALDQFQGLFRLGLGFAQHDEANRGPRVFIFWFEQQSAKHQDTPRHLPQPLLRLGQGNGRLDTR